MVRPFAQNEPINPKIKDSRSFSLDIMHSSKESTSEDADILAGAGAEEEEREDTEDEDKNYHLLFVLDSESSAKTFVTDLHLRPCEFYALSWSKNVPTVDELISIQ